MAITKADVEHVALLSRLELTEEEKEQYADSLTKIFAHVEQLNSVDVSGVEPTAHPLPLKDVLRKDVIQGSLTNEQALANAPDAEDGCFKVPQIV